MKKIKKFYLIFENGKKEITRHTCINEVKNCYLNKKVKTLNGNINVCVNVLPYET
jgi:hypothetical protein